MMSIDSRSGVFVGRANGHQLMSALICNLVVDRSEGIAGANGHERDSCVGEWSRCIGEFLPETSWNRRITGRRAKIRGVQRKAEWSAGSSLRARGKIYEYFSFLSGEKKQLSPYPA